MTLPVRKKKNKNEQTNPNKTNKWKKKATPDIWEFVWYSQLVRMFLMLGINVYKQSKRIPISDKVTPRSSPSETKTVSILVSATSKIENVALFQLLWVTGASSSIQHYYLVDIRFIETPDHRFIPAFWEYPVQNEVLLP